MTGPLTQLTHHYVLLQYDRIYEHELLMTNGLLSQHKHMNTKPLHLSELL